MIGSIKYIFLFLSLVSIGVSCYFYKNMKILQKIIENSSKNEANKSANINVVGSFEKIREKRDGLYRNLAKDD